MTITATDIHSLLRAEAHIAVNALSGSQDIRRVYDNTRPTSDAGDADVPPEDVKDEWVAVHVVDGDRFAAGIGSGLSKCARWVGTLVISFYVRAGIGSKRGIAAAQQIADHFEPKPVSLSAITVRTTRVLTRGFDPSGAWWRVDVQVPYQADDFAA